MKFCSSFSDVDPCGFDTFFPDVADEALSQGIQDDNPYADKKDMDQLPLYELDTIVSATDSFAFQNKIGEGGFGVVYKAATIMFQMKAPSKVLHNSEHSSSSSLFFPLADKNPNAELGSLHEAQSHTLAGRA
ncbi:unnamed protein product [Dovyalis caffra]|uniref:Uncharacterized protein n=1 Tax=Dovyalis caffra TaxID=77055 RepID=A0AAV1SH30_9ROSI|nr:unnamed protein product [Dovyalis caffra]